MSNIKQTKLNRVVHLDLLRLVAIFLVIFNHTGDRGYTLFINMIDSPISLFYMAFSVFCKIAVPLFFMISGALLLKKEESLKHILLKRVLRIATILFLVSIPYYYWLHKDNGIGILDFLKWIYSESATTALWYLYNYLSFLLMLPFLRSMVKNMKQKDFVYLLCGYLVFIGILPCMEYLVFRETGLLHKSLSPILFITQNVFFALMGYYFEHIFDAINHRKRTIIAGISLSSVAILITCLMTYYRAWTEGTGSVSFMESFFNSFVCVPTITVYYLMKCLETKIKNRNVCKCISVLGSAVFGVYLIEKMVRSITGIVYRALLPYLGSFIASLVWCLAVFCVGLAIVIPLKHIPFVKKIVNRLI